MARFASCATENRKESFIKRSTIVLLSVVAALALTSPVFGQHAEPKPPPAPLPPPFVEASAQDGKALIYIYITGPNSENLVRNASSTERTGLLVLAKSGPIGLFDKLGSYFSYVSEPGTIKLWLVGLYTTECKLEVVAGQIFYVKADFAGGFGIKAPEIYPIPNETAKKEIAKCWPQTE